MKTLCRQSAGMLCVMLLGLASAGVAGKETADNQYWITPKQVLASSSTHFPAILASLAKRRGADGKSLEASGAFDLVFQADASSRLTGFYDGTIVEGKALQSFRPLGADLYAGYRISDGTFPIYEDLNFTDTAGELKVGVLFSLLRDRDIDARRFAETNAQLQIREADLDLLLTRIGVQQRTLIAYWRWVAMGRQLSVYQDLLQIAMDRADGLQKQVEQGAQARIYLVENQQNITRRQTLVKSAERDFKVAANALSYYYRDASGAPLNPTRTQLPPQNQTSANKNLAVPVTLADSAALSRRPEINMIRTALERARQRITLAENDIKPRLDLRMELDHDMGSVAEGGISRDGTDAIVGLKFSVPLQQRVARGRLSQRRAEADALREEARLIEDQITVEINNILIELNVARELLSLASTEVDLSEQLRIAEQQRFESGASDFFLVNIREETAANAQIKYYVADMKRRVARAEFDAATVNLERLGLSDEAPLTP